MSEENILQLPPIPEPPHPPPDVAEEAPFDETPLPEIPRLDQEMVSSVLMGEQGPVSSSMDMPPVPGASDGDLGRKLDEVIGLLRDLPQRLSEVLRLG